MPVLDFAENSLDVVGYRTTTFAGVDDRNRVWCDRVREIGLRDRLLHRLEIEADCLVWGHRENVLGRTRTSRDDNLLFKYGEIF